MPGEERARRNPTFVVEIDEAELACRILEAIMQHRRPPGLTAKQALETQDEQSRQDVRRAARAAAQYLEECINGGQRPA